MKKSFRKEYSPTESFINMTQTTEEKAAPNTEDLKTLEELKKELPKFHTIEKEKKSVRLNLLLRPTTKKELKAEADRKDTSINNLINDILEEYINTQL